MQVLPKLVVALLTLTAGLLPGQVGGCSFSIDLVRQGPLPEWTGELESPSPVKVTNREAAPVTITVTRPDGTSETYTLDKGASIEIDQGALKPGEILVITVQQGEGAPQMVYLQRTGLYPGEDPARWADRG